MVQMAWVKDVSLSRTTLFRCVCSMIMLQLSKSINLNKEKYCI